MTDTTFITAASWEPRFLLGAQRVFSEQHFSNVICFWFEEFADRTKENRELFRGLTEHVHLRDVPLPMYDSKDVHGSRNTPAYAIVWRRVRELFDELNGRVGSFVLDISTMPRELLWIVLDLLCDSNVSGRIVYHRAERHGEWCGAEPERPHIVPKLGGLPVLDRPTTLLIVSGYDGDRSEQFIASYEPQQSLILYQEFPDGVNAENREKNEGRHKERFGNRGANIALSGINCYEADWGFQVILDAATELTKGANLILASLGPKTSAVSLYRVHRRLDESSLVYAPCRSYNESYSTGIGESLWLDWVLPSVLSGEK